TRAPWPSGDLPTVQAHANNMKTVFIYLSALVLFGLGIFATLEHGRKLNPLPPAVTSAPQPAANPGNLPGVEPSASLLTNLQENLKDPLPRLFLQLIVIILAARLAGALAVKFHQPAVIGEMIAGILLGPSLLGWWSPDAFHFIFPAASLGSLRLFSQMGV